MRHRLAALIAGLAIGLVGVGVAVADTGGRPLSTTLTGAEEAPGPGDADATGQADLTLNQGQNEVCFDISWADVDGTVFASHIHLGAAGTFGDVVVTLFTGTFSGTGSVTDCAEDVDADL